jgi:hypothetical protein
VILALVVSIPVAAQQAASIRGTIRDAQGATTAGATVTVVNVETGFQRSTVTRPVGTFALTQLPLGEYLLTVEAAGFRALVVQGIALNVADDRQIDGRLEVGAVTDQITVTSSNMAAETFGGEVASLVTGEQIRELPLNGRNFLQLTQLMPGVVTADSFDTKDKGLLAGDEVSVSIAGGRANSNLYTVDGANNNDVGANRTILVYPSLEAIEEFKIHRNSYGAEFGGASAAQINLVTRGGTNELRGSLFYFARRGEWNETNYMLKRADVEPDDLSRDDYGFTLGGALLRDKLHFFVSSERNDEIRGSTVSAGVPTAAERRGDFSRSDPACRPIPIDPLTFQPFPGDVIPEDRIGEAGLALLQLYPEPNAPGCLNWVTALDVPIDWRQINARFDWSLSERTRLMVRYTDDEWQNSSPTAGDTNGLWGDDPFPAIDSVWTTPSESLVAQLNSTIGDTALNTLTFSLSGNQIGSERVGDTALQERIRATNPPTFPAEAKLNYPQIAHPTFWGADGLGSFSQQSPWLNEQDLVMLKDDYTQVFGNHLFKAGFLYTDGKKLEPSAGSSGLEMPRYWGSTGAGGWGATSGNIVADFLLEEMTFGFQEFSPALEIDLEWTDIEVYAADSWKLRDNLTLDFGVRYSKFYWPEDTDGSMFLNFNPDRFDPALGGSPCNGLMQVPGTDPCGAGGFPGASVGPNAALIRHDANIAPRLGLAWDVFGTGKSVLRAGFGQFYQREAVGFHLGLVANPPAVRYASGVRSLDGEIQFLDYLGLGRPLVGIDVDASTPFTYQYNLSWEQRLGKDSTLEIGYVGSQGHDLPRSRDSNQVPLSRDVDGNGVNDRLDYVRCAAIDGACRGQYRPITAYADSGFWYYVFDGRSDYHSLQTQLITRFGRGSQLQVSYTLADFAADTSVELGAHGFSDRGSVTDLYRPGSDDGPADMRRRHVFNGSLIYNLPTFAGEGGLREWLLGAWSIGGIVIYATGTPLTVFSSTPGGDLGGMHPAAIGFSATRPLATGEPCRGRGDLGIVNPAAYTLTGYELGNSAQQMPRGSCDGPDFFQTDLAIYKRFPLTGRFDLQLRLEVFNLFNTVNLIGWSADLGFNPPVTLDAPRQEATVVTETGQLPSTFGLASGVRDARQFQVGVKFSF